jgi:hypothetical protein
MYPQYRPPIMAPNLGPQFGTPIWDPDLRPDLGPGFGPQIWTPILDPQCNMDPPFYSTTLLIAL